MEMVDTVRMRAYEPPVAESKHQLWREPVEVRICTDTGSRPVGHIRRVDSVEWESGAPLELSGAQRFRLRGIIEHVPHLALSGAGASGDLYAVTFTDATALRMGVGDLAMQKASGGGLRAVAVDSSGRIVEHGALDGANFIQAAAIGAFAWTILSVIVGKKYLSDIDHKLRTISDGVQALQGRMDATRFGELIGDVQALRRYSTELRSGGLEPDLRQHVIGEFLGISRNAKKHWHTAVQELALARSPLHQLASQPALDETAVLGCQGLIDRLALHRLQLELATSLRAECEHMLFAVGYDMAAARDELGSMLENHRMALTKDEHVIGLLLPRIKSASEPWWFGKDEFKRRRSEIVTRMEAMLREEESQGIDFTRKVIEHVDRGLLASRPLRVGLRRSASGEVIEARLLGSEPLAPG